MTRFPLSFLLFSLVFTAFCNHSVEAFCSKCAKIEEERAKEQEAHPQTIGYYDEQAKTSQPIQQKEIAQPKEIANPAIKGTK